MSEKLNKNQIERFSRQIILKNIGILGQNKITNAKKTMPNKVIKSKIIFSDMKSSFKD